MGAIAERGAQHGVGHGGLERLSQFFQQRKQETRHHIPIFDESGRMTITDDPFLIPASSLGLPFDIACSGGGTSLRLVGREADQESVREHFDAGLRVFIISDDQNVEINALPERARYQALKELSGSSWQRLVESLDGHKPSTGSPYWFIAMSRGENDTNGRLPPDIARFRIDPEHLEIRQYIQNQRLTIRQGDTFNWKLLTRDAPLIIMDTDHPRMYIHRSNVIVIPELKDTFLSTFDQKEAHQQLPLYIAFDTGASGTFTLSRPMWPTEQVRETTTKSWRDWSTIPEEKREWIFRGVDGAYIMRNGHPVTIVAMPHEKTIVTGAIDDGVQSMILTSRTGYELERGIATFSFSGDWMTLTSGPDHGTRSPQGVVIYQRIGQDLAKHGEVSHHTSLTREKAYAMLHTPIPVDASGDELRRYGQMQREALEFLFPGSQSATSAAHPMRQARTRVGSDNPLLVRHA